MKNNDNGREEAVAGGRIFSVFCLLIARRDDNFGSNIFRGLKTKQLVIDIVMEIAKVEMDARELTAQFLLVPALLLTHINRLLAVTRYVDEKRDVEEPN